MSEQTEPNKDEKKEERIKIEDISDGAETKELRFTKRFLMTYTAEDGTILKGEFTIKRPTIGEQSRIGVLSAELREDRPVRAFDRATLAMHDAMAVCTVMVQKSPDWFKIDDMYDIEPLMRVYEEALAFNDSFRKKRVE